MATFKIGDRVVFKKGMGLYFEPGGEAFDVATKKGLQFTGVGTVCKIPGNNDHRLADESGTMIDNYNVLMDESYLGNMNKESRIVTYIHADELELFT